MSEPEPKREPRPDLGTATDAELLRWLTDAWEDQSEAEVELEETFGRSTAWRGELERTTREINELFCWLADRYRKERS